MSDKPTRTVDNVTKSAADPAATTGGDGQFTTANPPPASTGRYALGEEIARGGMGVIYRATDIVLSREVAVKVLSEKFGPAPAAAHRFADEARIAAQLQHPAIPPVHDLGTLPDGRPFLAMKLIKGDTLDALLAARPDPSADRGRFVAAFEQVCHALAFAHSHNVIHRDLKPANIMVGNFGEVQVMDWGLAKVLSASRERERQENPNETAAAATEIRSLRESDGSETQAGSILGTPAFMPPEQAVGAVGKIDARSDVFGLGAVLAVILTEQPPFAAESAETTRVKAAQGDVNDCFARLEVSGADPELVALCKRCLAPKQEDRPADSGAVAKAVAALRAAADERARQAEIDRAAAELKAAEQRKRRRTVVVAASAITVVLALGIIGTALGFLRADQQRKNAEGAWQSEADQRRAVEEQRDVIANREKQVAAQKKIADDRLKVYQKAVDRFVNDAPALIEGHPLGSTPYRDLLEIGGKLLREVQGTVDDQGLAVRGEMSSIIRQGNFAKAEGRIDDAARFFDAAFKMGEELLRTSTPEEKGKNAGNLALVIGLRASILQIRGEIQAGSTEKAQAREKFAEAARLHNESIALYRRVMTEPEIRDIHVGEAEMWLAGAYLSLAEMYHASVVAAENDAGKRAAHEATRVAAKEAEEHFAAGLATGWKERSLDRTRLRQALASYERARAADNLDRLDEAEAAFQKSFELFDSLVKETPKNLLHRIHFAKLAADQGFFLIWKLHDNKRAEAAFIVAVDQNRRIGRPVELNQYFNAMATNLYRAGVAAFEAGDKVRAREHFLKCVAAREEQLREAIRVSDENSLYAESPRIGLMLAQGRAGDHVNAAAFAAELRKKYDTNPARLSYATQGFALAAAATDNGEQAAAYRDKAFEALTRAVEVGYRNVEEVERDPDFEPLRRDPRFPPLVERAKANAARKQSPLPELAPLPRPVKR
jgi:Protein kinase domain